MSDSELRISKFDMDRFKVDYVASVLIFGKRNSGKTNLAKDIAMHRNLDRSLVVCNSAEIADSWRSWPAGARYRHWAPFLKAYKNIVAEGESFKDTVIGPFRTATSEFLKEKIKKKYLKAAQTLIDQYVQIIQQSDRSKLELLIQEFKFKAEELKKQEKIEYDAVGKQAKDIVNERVKPKAWDIYIDDWGSERDVMYSTELKTMFNNGRHPGVAVTCLCQKPTQINKEIRTGPDFVFVARTESADEIDALHKLFFKRFFPKLQTFTNFFLSVTQNYQFLVLDQSIRDYSKKQDQKIEDFLFYYKAPDLSGAQIKIGSAEFNYYMRGNEDETEKVQKLKQALEEKKQITLDMFKSPSSSSMTSSSSSYFPSKDSLSDTFRKQLEEEHEKQKKDILSLSNF
jgi:hypothetical protein